MGVDGMSTRPGVTAIPHSPRLKSRTRQTNWRLANLAKYEAHLAVRRALASGALEKQGCEVCGSVAVDAHHERYDAPLDVRWLCRCHHVRLHRGGEDLFGGGGGRVDAKGRGADCAEAGDGPDKGSGRPGPP